MSERVQQAKILAQAVAHAITPTIARKVAQAYRADAVLEAAAWNVVDAVTRLENSRRTRDQRAAQRLLERRALKLRQIMRERDGQ